jgi:two-component system, chemotaxis family, CheB/CheR fusion protein
MADQTSNVCIVGIGASAGGIESLREFFDAVPAETGLAFVVIQHLSPNQPSQMAALLSKCTRMKVVQAEDGATIAANHVYTIPPGKFIFTKEGKLYTTDPIQSDGLRMPIDFFFRSLAKDQGENAVAVLFSGSGSDGTLGIREIHGLAGLVLVQDPKTAQFDSMIEHALATGMVDYALPVRDIPPALLRYVDQYRAAERNPPDGRTMHDGLASIIELLANQNKGDFRSYKPPTLQRRIQRRMGLNQIDEISDYYRFLAEQPAELTKLSQDVLIGVTSFFRDPQAFEELRDKVIAPLVQEKNHAEPLRAWVAGCATGEEAYSIVMLLMEEMARARKSFRLQVFASDIDAEALKGARAGIFPQSIASDLSEERLARFFTKQDGTYQIDKQVREAVTFAAHNVVMDPPFLNMELISCRNLLIYIEPEMQKKILSLFAFGLKPGGYLFLGKSENPVEHSDAFEALSKSSRIFRRKASVAAHISAFALRDKAPAVSPGVPERHHPIRLSDLNQQVLLKHFNASIVLVDEHGQIRHFYGPTHKYLSHPFGDASLSLFDMAENRHAPQLRLLIERAARQNGAVRLEGLDFSRDGATDSVNVTVTPVVDADSVAKLFAVIFEDARAPVKGRASRRRGRAMRNETVMARLEAENKSLREQIQATSDGFQTTHEELTAANEEVTAINEELQSTNEELVTSKEELQSLNEELITTNNQLNDKVDELGKTNDDLANFLNSSEVGTIFLDRKFCIRRFTPSATTVMNLLPLDLGRPLSHISNKFIDTDLIAIADQVLKTSTPVEKEVLSADGLWQILRCLPYRTSNDVIDGVVFTFTDVTRLKRSERAMVEARDYAENILQATLDPLLVLDPGLKVVSANPAFLKTFQVSPEETEGHLIYELGNHQWDIPALRNLLERILPDNSVVVDFEVKHDFPGIGTKIMSVDARRIYNREMQAVQLILLTIKDVTERKPAEEARAMLAAVVDSSEDAIISKTLDGTITSWNAGAERLFGYRAKEMIGQPITRLIPSDRQEEEAEILLTLRLGKPVDHFDTVRVGRDNRPIDVSLTISPIKDAKGNVIGASKIARDITERVRLEQQRHEFNRELEKLVSERTGELEQAHHALIEDLEERKKLEDQLRQAQKMESLGTLAAGIAHDLNNILNIIQGYTSILGDGGDSGQIAESVAAITETTNRGSALVQQLLTLGRKTETKFESTNANTLVQELGNLIKETFPKNIELALDLARRLPSIMADQNQFTQVLLNLCVNARDAMPDGGRLSLKTRLVHANDLEKCDDLKAEEYVSIEITDTGTGMDENVQSKIFEPFFTTKEIGQGTGLGLAVVYGIVKSHHGFIRLQSTPLQGTTFAVYFPVESADE